MLKQEPSAQSPWQKTMLGLVCVLGFTMFSFDFGLSLFPVWCTSGYKAGHAGTSDVSGSTISLPCYSRHGANILKKHGIEPAPSVGSVLDMEGLLDSALGTDGGG